eukprot:FR743465.1.p3 GENE.FR743465.1~~FR743465.1.p3  ORF type:complete len:120 (-),score=44.16 FR743465.1:787-1146(-)
MEREGKGGKRPHPNTQNPPLSPPAWGRFSLKKGGPAPFFRVGKGGRWAANTINMNLVLPWPPPRPPPFFFSGFGCWGEWGGDNNFPPETRLGPGFPPTAHLPLTKGKKSGNLPRGGRPP